MIWDIIEGTCWDFSEGPSVKPEGFLRSYWRWWKETRKEEGMVRKQGDRETQRERREAVSGGRELLGPRNLTCISHSVWLTGEVSLSPN